MPPGPRAGVAAFSVPLLLLGTSLLTSAEQAVLLPGTDDDAPSSGGQPKVRTDFSQVQLSYLGRDRVLAFNQWTGEHALWQFERDELSKCDAFTWPPLSQGKWAALRYHEFVFAGFTHLISLDPRRGAMTLTECDDAAFLPRCRGESLRCSPLFQHQLTAPGGAAALGANSIHELSYLGGDLLLHYERGSGHYAILAFSRCAPPNGTVAKGGAPRCGVAPTPLATGTLPSGAHHTYLGGDLVLAYLPHSAGSYEMLKVQRNSSGGGGGTAAAVATHARLERVGGGKLPIAASWSQDGRRHRLLSVHSGLLLDYDKEEGTYRLLDLLHQPEPLGVSSGVGPAGPPASAQLTAASPLRHSVRAAGTLPAGAASGCAAHQTSYECLGASGRGEQCGWCQASGRCVRGDPWGPCRRAECAAADGACGMWHSPAGLVTAAGSGWSSAPAAVEAPSRLPSSRAASDGGDLGPPPASTPVPSASASAPAGLVPLPNASCVGCATGGLGLAGGAAAALALCAACPGSPPSAALAPAGVFHSLASFALRTLRLRTCARSASPTCALLSASSIRALASASSRQLAAMPEELAHEIARPDDADASSELVEAPPLPAPAGGAAVSVFTLACVLGRPDGRARSVLELEVVVERPSGHDGDAGVLLLTSARLSLASAPPEGGTAAPPEPQTTPTSVPMASPLVSPLLLDAREFGAYATLPTPATATAAAAPLAHLGGPTAHPTAPLSFAPHELSYLGYDAVLDFDPASARLSIWQVDSKAAEAGAAPLLTPPLMTSTWTATHRRFAYLGFDYLLEYDPASGAYFMHQCPHQRWRAGLQLLCSSLCPPSGCGTSTDLAGDTKVLYLGHDALLTLHAPTGAFALLKVQRSPAKLVAPPGAATTDGAPAGV